MRFKLLGTAVLLIGSAQYSFGSGIYTGCFGGASLCTFDGSGIVTVTGSTNISWMSDALGSAANFFTLSGGTGVFSVIPNGSQETIQDIGTHPVGTVFGPVAFMAFPTAPTLDPGGALMLNFIQPGHYLTTTCGGVALGGQTCTPALASSDPGPFNFVNSIDNNTGIISSTATFSFSGVSADGSGKWNGIFTSQFIGQSFQQVLDQLATTGSVQRSYSSTELVIDSSIPEPGSLIMIGSGLLGLAAILRRRRSVK